MFRLESNLVLTALAGDGIGLKIGEEEQKRRYFSRYLRIVKLNGLARVDFTKTLIEDYCGDCTRFALYSLTICNPSFF